MIEKIVNVERVEDLIAVFGSFDENIRRIEDALGVNIVNRGNELKIVGDAEGVDKAARTLEGLLTIAARGEVIDEQRVRYLLTLVQEGNDDQVTKIAKDVVCISATPFFRAQRYGILLRDCRRTRGERILRKYRFV